MKLNLTFDILAMFADGGQSAKVAGIVFDEPTAANLNKTRG